MRKLISAWLIFLLVFTKMIGSAYGSSSDCGTAPQIIIVPGYKASPEDHWFPWLAMELSARNICSRVLNMPSPGQPKLSDWIDTLEKAAARPNSDLFIVAHSLGAHAVLHWLSDLPKDSKLGGVVLVSPFLNELPALPELDPVIRRPQKLRLVELPTDRLSVIAASDDYLVPSAMSENVAHLLKAEFIRINQGGHFLGSDGFSRFPTALDALLKLASKKDYSSRDEPRTSDTQA